MGGLIEHPVQWTEFELWRREKLVAPFPGKPALKRFHMAQCMAREEDFRGWKDGEVDALVHDLRQIILKTGLQGYACAISIEGWDEYIRGALRQCMGDAEQYSVISGAPRTARSPRGCESHPGNGRLAR
jgi:hypothetical protein